MATVPVTRSLKRFTVVLAVLLAFILIAVPVLAAYSASVTVANTTATSYPQIGVRSALGTTFLVTNDYITATGLDTRVEAAGVSLPHMLTDDKLMFSTSVPATSSTVYQFTTGNSTAAPYDHFYIIPGYNGGYITTTDDPLLRLGADGYIETKGYVDTNYALGKYVFRKAGAVSTGITASQEITTSVFPDTYYNRFETNTNDTPATGATWLAMTFRANSTFLLSEVELLVDVWAVPAGDGIVSIRATSGGLPTGPDLASFTQLATAYGAGWEVCDIEPDIVLTEGTVYAIILRAPGAAPGSGIIWFYDGAAGFKWGQYCASADSGVIWTADPTRDFDFRITGNPAVRIAGAASGAKTLRTTVGTATNGSMEQVLVGGAGNPPDGVNTHYVALTGGGWYPVANERYARTMITSPGIIKNLYVETDTAPGAGASEEYTLMLNGIATTLTCTITDPATTANDITHSVRVYPGDFVYLREVPAGGPVFTQDCVRYSLLFVSDNTTDSIMYVSDTLGAGGPWYVGVYGGYSSWWGGDETRARTVMPTAGTLKRFLAACDTPPGAGTSRVFTVRKNGVDTGLTVTVAGTADSASNIINTVSVVAGDMISISHAVTGAPAGNYLTIGMTFTASIPGEFVAASQAIDNNIFAAANTEYAKVTGSGGVWSVLETIWSRQLAQSMTISKMYGYMSTGVADMDATFTYRQNGGDTTLVLNLLGIGASGSNLVNTVAIADGDTLTLRADKNAGGIGAAFVNLSCVGTRPLVNHYTLSLSLGGVSQGTAVLDAGVTSNASPYIWSEVNACPYFEYISLTQGANPRIHYHPDNIIAGTVLPNIQVPGSYVGAFTWGTNPALVTAVVDGLISSTAYTTSAVEPGGTSVLAVTSIDDTKLAPGDAAMTGVGNPFYDIVRVIADAMGCSMAMAWAVCTMVVALAFGAGLGVLAKKGFLTSLICTLLIIGSYLANVVPLGWVIGSGVITICIAICEADSGSIYRTGG